MYNFFFRDTEYVPRLALFSVLGLDCHSRRRLVELSSPLLEEKDYLIETIFVVRQMASMEAKFLFDGRDDDEETMLLTKEGADKYLLSYNILLMNEVLFTKNTKLRVVK